MFYRPHAEHRRNSQGVVLPLTAAIHRVFGNRAQDLARPIGAFYPRHVSGNTWLHLGGIWYRARDEHYVLGRTVDEQVVQAFAISITTGDPVSLPNGIQVTWEPIPRAQAAQLPPPLTASHQ
ncbi:hypothetical protein [Pseudomonas chlororaphis]|uniref:Uncharacterized protein n=1 Tax=Pseudomonas chlororaphis TaxID=587753 RepID=A0A1Q8EQD2_9PSED|nr:hypothetical protein [Pseudomonas chlororaphis]OLF54008.1 hypothetical protein BTN82_13190 [Pseudomonas chlororaphis]